MRAEPRWGNNWRLLDPGEATRIRLPVSRRGRRASERRLGELPSGTECDPRRRRSWRGSSLPSRRGEGRDCGGTNLSGLSVRRCARIPRRGRACARPRLSEDHSRGTAARRSVVLADACGGPHPPFARHVAPRPDTCAWLPACRETSVTSASALERSFEDTSQSGPSRDPVVLRPELRSRFARAGSIEGPEREGHRPPRLAPERTTAVRDQGPHDRCVGTCGRGRGADASRSRKSAVHGGEPDHSSRRRPRRVRRAGRRGDDGSAGNSADDAVSPMASCASCVSCHGGLRGRGRLAR